MDRALAIVGLGISAVSIFPTPELSDTTRYFIGYSGLLMAAAGFAMMARDWRAPVVSRVRGWIGRGQATAAPIPRPEYVSLYEAALRAYEETQDSFLANAAERLGEDGPISWYATMISERFPLYGRHPPSRLTDLFDTSGFSLRVEGSSIVATQSWGQDRWEDVAIRSADLDRVLAYAKERAAVLDK